MEHGKEKNGGTKNPYGPRASHTALPDVSRPTQKNGLGAPHGHQTTSQMRVFGTGATRDSEDGKLDFEGFFSPLALEEFARYMNRHRRQKDGTLRDSDNWQKGIPLGAYMKSMWRHFFSVWKNHRGIKDGEDMKTSLSALLFNVQGYLHEYLKQHDEQGEPDQK
jgi:hypothetical protein